MLHVFYVLAVAAPLLILAWVALAYVRRARERRRAFSRLGARRRGSLRPRPRVGGAPPPDSAWEAQTSIWQPPAPTPSVSAVAPLGTRPAWAPAEPPAEAASLPWGEPPQWEVPQSTAICSECAEPVRSGARICKHCRHPLAEGGDAPGRARAA
ncbi:MAG: hypothetical protein E6G56_02720 [Actinobacteria bacterium]|nr:MAG: hypothetical protein E6G56_02720 [Actinomycetota bacterium]